MNSDAMATRLSVLSRALPMRVLIVDDDELELALMSDRIASAGFDVVRAANGEEALTLLERQWFPLVITDWQMPVMDGIALTEALRARGVDDTYVIMLTMREASLDYERGYMAGVDDYLTKKLPDAELFARIHAGFNTLALRRSLKETRSALEVANPLDEASGAFATRELLTRLHGEICRAQRYDRQLSVLIVGVRAAGASPLSSSLLAKVVRALRGVVRGHVDWIGRMTGGGDDAAFAIVLPEAGPTDGTTIKERMRVALAAPSGDVSGATDDAWDDVRPIFSFGFASLQRGGRDAAPLEAEDLLAVAGLCRVCVGHAGPEQLCAVQRSVASGVTISCRHGYAVDSHCRFKAQAPLVGTHKDESVPGADSQR